MVEMETLNWMNFHYIKRYTEHYHDGYHPIGVKSWEICITPKAVLYNVSSVLYPNVVAKYKNTKTNQTQVS